jgi:tartrate dehydratase beta subunit/fumarate hydratase class I family protein
VGRAGPAQAKPCRAIGSAGPTTSGRIDAYSPKLMEIGLKAMIGTGMRKKEVVEAIFAGLFTLSVAILLALATRVFFGIFFKG